MAMAMAMAIQGFAAGVTDVDMSRALENFGCTILGIKTGIKTGIKMHHSDLPDRRLAVISVDTERAGTQTLAKRINGHSCNRHMLPAEAFLFG